MEKMEIVSIRINSYTKFTFVIGLWIQIDVIVNNI